jgi:hypothetical protein
MADLAPLVLFAYKRPRHTLAVLQSLAANPEAARCRLTIHCDGPKNAGEEAAVAEVRRVVRARPWCGQVDIFDKDINFGLARSVSAGVTDMLRRHDHVIVLEDDLVLSRCFLRFMNAALARYRDEPRVMQISGYMFPIPLPAALETCFLPMISSWGWATWARAWQLYDPAMSGYERLVAGKKRRRRFDLGGSYPFFDLLQDQCAGRIDSWGIRWYLSVFERHGVTLFPARSYVHNQGWDGSGTHCAADGFYDSPLTERMIERFPDSVAVTPPALQALRRYFRGRSVPRSASLLRRLLSRVKRTLLH